MVSALAAGFGVLVTLLWVGDGSQRANVNEQQSAGVIRGDGSTTAAEMARLQDELVAQSEMLAQIAADNLRLTQRLRELERLEFGDPALSAGTELPTHSTADAAVAEAREEVEDDDEADLPPAQRLVRAGIEPALAEAIQQRISALEMERLYLRDQATREGWRNSDRFTQAMRELLRPEDALRREFGDDVYDAYLYAMGRGNRVLIASTLQDSPADVAGIRAGDTVLSYAGERVYSISDLQSATTSGEPGASVVVELMRDGVRWYATVPRGPLGVRLDITRRAPGTG